MAEFKNEWFGGRNSDTDPTRLPANQYISANNLELVGDGAFTSLRNIKGTDLVQQLSTSATFRILHVRPNWYSINGEQVGCITIFSVDSTTFKIQCYDTENDTLYNLFSETVPADYSTTVTDVDAATYPENGVDIVYFTDFYNEMRYLKCEIPSPYSANFLTAYDLSLLRRGANGTITSAVGTTGTLLSGTYQFSYRMADPTNKRFTKWSTLTNPIHVYSAANSTSPVYSGIGLITNRKITLTITPSAEETDNYDYLQIAVVENTGATDPITASLLEIEAIGGTSLTYDYKSNSKIGSIPLNDIVVDLAQIDRVKTLNIKDNRLFGANIHYAELEFDNGTPTVGSGTVITQASSGTDSFSSDEFSSNYKGYFRGEVYRFGVVYEDEHGNRSPVQPLDLSAITDNDITVGLTDLKFPDRTNSSYTLFNGSGYLQSIGLRLTGLTNHPSWARKLEIVRVDRKGRFKNILFQTPILPMSRIYGIGALHSYPNVVTYGIDQEREETDASPMTSSYTIVPKNLFWPEPRNIIKVTSNSGSGTSKKIAGESRLYYSTLGYAYSMIFPTSAMYGDQFKYTGAEKLDMVDLALLKMSFTTGHPTKDVAVVAGDDLNTNISATFHALSNDQYYYNSGHAKPSMETSFSGIQTNLAVTDYEFFDNFGTTDSVAGQAVMDYDALQTGGVDFGFKPNIQRSAVVKLDTATLDVVMRSATFSAATWNGYNLVASPITSANASLNYEGAFSYTNNYINERGADSSDYVNLIAIANVKLGVGDDRYGEATDLQEYISTGCTYTFSEAEVATLEGGGSVVLGDLDVWGGDCFVSAHTFKVCDSTYSVVNQSKHSSSAQSGATLLSKWNNTLFEDLADDTTLSIPVAVENAAQYVQVILESEYNGAVMEQDILSGSSTAIPVMTGGVETARTPLTYRYNPNLSKNNSQKIYVSEPQFSFKQSEFGARVFWTDLKIYNSDQSGFDVVRVADFYDIEEKYRPITKLALAGDNLYAIHEQGIIYLPTGERQVEQADGGMLAVRSGDVIGGKIIIDSERGCQHLRGIVETGNVVYIPDNRNKSIYALSGQQLIPITKDNETIFRSFFSTVKSNLVGVYDPIRKEFWIADGTDCHVFNEGGFWVSNYTLNLKGSASTNQKLYIIGLNGADTSIYTMYTGTVNQLCGASVTPDVTFAINPHPDFSKTFDNSMVNASERLSSIEFVVNYESSIGNQTATVSLDEQSHENNFRVKNPRDANGARLRGLYCQATIEWKAVQSALRAFYTKYRFSSRTPW